MENLYWFGARESDIMYTNELFRGSITLYGSGKNNNISFCNESPVRINHNIITEEQDNFTIQQILSLYQKDPNAKCMFYNPHIFYNYKPLSALSHMVQGLNSEEVLAITDDKIKFRNLMKEHVPFLKYYVLSGKKQSYDGIKKLFEGSTEFVIQAPVSCGGCGTFVVRPNTFSQIYSQIQEDSEYLVMKYEENSISVNLHAIIYDEDIVLSPGSIQIIREIDNRLIYKGADFISYSDTPCLQREAFKKASMKVCQILQSIGYRGVLGIDGIFTSDGEVYISEVNGRFQASTHLLNKALFVSEKKSLHQMNIDAFSGKRPNAEERNLESLVVPYSNYVFSFSNTDFHSKHFLKICEREKHIVEIIKDGYSDTQSCEPDAYLFKVVFDTNITSVSPDNVLLINQNIAEPSTDFYYRINKKDKLSLKIALLNQGVFISDEVLNQFEKSGGIRPATNGAVDISFPYLNNMVINCPRTLKFSKLTPFSLEMKKPYGLSLFYYGAYLSKINLWQRDPYEKKLTQNKVPFEAIAYLSTDRLRLHHTTECIFKKLNQSCKFCDIQPCEGKISNEDIEEVIAFYTNNVFEDQNNKVALRHFLIGGQSDLSEREYSAICDTIKIIRKYSNNGIYIMCLPPDNHAIIDKMHQLGATEVAFNIEIFDPETAKKYMPGKGSINRNKYYNALSHAVSVFGAHGNVRSLVVVGLEKTQSLYDGLYKLIDMGVQPILSVFRPLPDTELENLIHPSNDYLYTLYNDINSYCKTKHMHLGPDCTFCQNNTLSLPYTRVAENEKKNKKEIL